MSAKEKQYVMSGKDSAERIRSREELRRSGAAGKHDNRPRRLRTRKAAKDAAIHLEDS
jgi:hypothetical protein